MATAFSSSRIKSNSCRMRSAESEANQRTGRRDKRQRLRSNLETVALFIADRAEQAGRIIQERFRMENTYHATFQIVQTVQIIAQFTPMIPIDAQSQGIDGEIAASQVILEPCRVSR